MNCLKSLQQQIVKILRETTAIVKLIVLAKNRSFQLQCFGNYTLCQRWKSAFDVTKILLGRFNYIMHHQH
jgi:hypothetical protein